MGDSLQSFVCRICSITCTGPETLQQHFNGSKHMKKERLSQLYPPVHNSSEAQASQSLFQSRDYSCQVCQTVMSGPEAYLAHMAGKPHAKKVKQQELIKSMSLSNASLTLESNIQPETVEITPATEAWSMPSQPSSFYFCSLCEVPLSGPESARSHYLGSQHSKKQKRSQYESAARPGFSESLDFCSLCSVPLSGLESARAHFAGAAHQKKLKLNGNSPSNTVSQADVMNGSFSNLHLTEKPKNISKEIAVEADGTEELRESYRQAENEVVEDQDED